VVGPATAAQRMALVDEAMRTLPHAGRGVGQLKRTLRHEQLREAAARRRAGVRT
jgi:hypothetical protein